MYLCPFWQSQITQLVHYVGLQQKPYLSSSGSLFNFGKSTVYLKHWFCKAAKKTRQYASPPQRFGDTERRVRPGTVSVGVHEVCVCSTYNPFLHPTHYTFQLSQPSSIICLLRIEANRKKRDYWITKHSHFHRQTEQGCCFAAELHDLKVIFVPRADLTTFLVNNLQISQFGEQKKSPLSSQ